MAGVYKEICILKSYELNNIHLDESFSDSSYSNDYASIALLSENKLYLEPINTTIITKFFFQSRPLRVPSALPSHLLLSEGNAIPPSIDYLHQYRLCRNPLYTPHLHHL